MIYRLIILNGDRRGEQITLTQEPMIIGRSEASEIRLNDPEIAMTHAEITHRADGIHIRDLGSMNRLLINNREVREAHPKHGDVVEVGHTRFLVQAYVQAEVQEREEMEDDDEEKAERRRPWIVGAVIILIIAGLFLGIPRCERLLIGNRSRPVKAVPTQVRPPPARTNTPILSATHPTPKAVVIPPAQETALPPPTPKPDPKGVPPPPQTEPTATNLPPAGVQTVAVPAKPAPEDNDAPPPPSRPSPTTELIANSQKELLAASEILATRSTGITNPPVPSVPMAATHPAILPPPPEAVSPPETPVPAPVVAPPVKVITNEPAEPVTSHPAIGLIRISSTDINKFPETDQFREMRLLTIRLTATDREDELDSGAVRIEVTFLDKERATGRIVQASPRERPASMTVQGTWRSNEQKTLVASYVVPATQPATERLSQYYGFIVRVYYHGVLQDESCQPKDLPAGIAPVAPGGTPQPASP